MVYKIHALHIADAHRTDKYIRQLEFVEKSVDSMTMSASVKTKGYRSGNAKATAKSFNKFYGHMPWLQDNANFYFYGVKFKKV